MIAEIQRAIFAALNENISAPVFDRAPQNKSRPYVLIGDVDIDSDDTDDADGYQALCSLETWSNYAGRAEARAIADEMKALLHYGTLDIDGFVGCVHESTDASDSDDGVVVTSEFRVFIHLDASAS